MALDGCGLLCKYILIIFNIIFAVLGLACLGLGLWLRLSPNTRGFFQIQELNSSAFVMAVIVLIAIGAVLLIVSSFGDYGACNEKRCSLQVFSVLLTILALAVIAVGVLAYSCRDRVVQSIVEFYSTMYAMYAASGDPVIGATLTFIHNTLDCCGMTGITLLEFVKNTCTSSFFTRTCPGVIGIVFENNAPAVLGVFLGTGGLLIIALICSIILIQMIKRVQQMDVAYHSQVY
ncbi:CD9 antigen isoform X2 [Antennarius striatus]|uniref:CD9 antigen isoform X2 n=1 Tax=Antennarius striatus TaxID=241820 RepID=UPI0035B2BAD2